MKITIVPVDAVVLINGILKIIDMSELIDPSIHAVQWDGTKGEIEYVADSIQNEAIENIDAFQNIIDTYNEIE